MTSTKPLSELVDALVDKQISFLTALVAIPSVSADPERSADVSAAAALVAKELEALGFEADIYTAAKPDGSQGAPAVIAQKLVNPRQLTVLLYAHHDVQPEGDHALWESPPFEAQVRNGRIYGRGTSDDGAGVAVHLGALEALGDRLPVNVKVFIEGEEEVGSPSFSNLLDTYRERLNADVIVVADSANWDENTPSITASLRGVATVDVSVRVLQSALHSGLYGGPILDAITVAARLVSTLHDSDGNVAVKGLGGHEQADAVMDEQAFREEASVVEGYELAGTGPLAARLWSMPALAVTGIDAPSTAQGANAIVPECTFRLSLRTVPGQSTQDSVEALIEHLEEHVPFGAELSISVEETGSSYIADLDSGPAQLLKDALASAYGTEVVATGLGASIPFIADFERVFPDAKILITGVEDPATAAHSPNESQSISTLRNATLAQAKLLLALADYKP